MTTYEQKPRAEDVLASLKLAPAEVPGLPGRARMALIAYLMRWQHYGAARRCLEQLLVTHSHLVSVYDDLARVHLALEQPGRALELMRRRQAQKVSTLSQGLEARAHLAAGDVPAARAIADELRSQHPTMQRTWRLRAEVCLADGEFDEAEAALKELDALHPEAADTALRLALLWQARGDAQKALLWARTALSRSERDERPPGADLLRLLEALYRATGQDAQAEATAARQQRRREREIEALRRLLSGGGQEAPARPRPEEWPQPARDRDGQPGRGLPARQAAELPPHPELSAEERSRLEEALHRHFPHAGFRPGQAEVIAAVLRGESVLAVMPTGAGKSLCYQLAALLLPGTTLVISPLIALMKDQLDGLPEGVAARATTINSTLDGSELEARLDGAARGEYRLLYAAPERLRQRPFLHALGQAGISLMVVDEVHCVSLWGHDFRPDYHFIAKAWQELGSPPILGMTATATPRVRDDVQAALGRMRLVATEVHRPNLRLEGRFFANEAEKKRALVALCRQIEGSGIVYANSRLKCEELATLLRRRGVSAIHYHAGIDDRAAAQDRFMSGEARVVVATVAFGMGVDKADVRFIVHFHPPRSLENYYQEAGRAGRDGRPARCILFYARSDKNNLTRWNRQDALQIDFLRGVYAAIQRRLGGQEVGLINTADLERDLRADATRIRVAIHFLEGAGLVWRGFDLPRTAGLTLRQPPGGTPSGTPGGTPGGKPSGMPGGTPGGKPSGMPGGMPGGQAEEAFRRLVEAARLLPGQAVSRDLLALSHDAALDPRRIEARLLAWEEAGWLSYRGVGRDMLLALSRPPDDSRQRVAAMVADYRAGQESRIAEIMAYAATRLCRHGYISAYFGGQPIEHCTSCDNCLGAAAKGTPAAAKGAPAGAERTAAGAERAPMAPRPEAAPSRPVPRAAAAAGGDDPGRVILQAVAQLPFAVGRTGLSRILQGSGSSPIQADEFPLFGALAGLTQKRIRELADRLLAEGFLETFYKGNRPLVQLTTKGRQSLDAPPAESGATVLPAPAAAEVDGDLLERLRTWQRATARELKVPPYRVFPNATLERIAARRPATLDELVAVKGVGPKKLEQFGQAVLELIAGGAVTL